MQTGMRNSPLVRKLLDLGVRKVRADNVSRRLPEVVEPAPMHHHQLPQPKGGGLGVPIDVDGDAPEDLRLLLRHQAVCLELLMQLRVLQRHVAVHACMDTRVTAVLAGQEERPRAACNPGAHNASVWILMILPSEAALVVHGCILLLGHRG